MVIITLNKLKKTLLLTIAIALAVVMLPACSAGSQPSSSSASDAEQKQTRVITDSQGREVEIPVQVERIVPLGNTPRMIAYLGLAEKVVGIGGMKADQVTPLQAYAYANKDVWAGLPLVGTDAAGATDYYPEQIISVQPDVILCSYTKELADEISSKTGIPVVAVPMGTLFEDDYKEALRLLGDVCGTSDRAEEVITFIDTCLADLSARTIDVPESQKPSVLGAAATFKGPHGIDGVYVNYPVFTAIHARDVVNGVSEAESAFIVDKEQILGWNPDIIFLDAGNVNLVKDDVTSNPDFFAQLAAYNDGQIYQYPNSTSYYSNVEIPIVNSYYVASLLYPEQFKDISFEEKASEVFEFFLDVPDYLNTLEAAGYGYGKVELG